MASEFTSHFSRPVGVPPTSGVSHVPDALPNSYEPATHSKFLVPAWHGMWGVFATRKQRQRAQRITERSPTLNPSIHCKKKSDCRGTLHWRRRSDASACPKRGQARLVS